MKKIIVSDYDNTFYRNDDDIEKNKLKVKEFMELSNIFIIATGRSYLDFMEKEDLYKIKYNYLILDHGATILKDDEKRGTMAKVSLEKIRNYTVENMAKEHIRILSNL